MAETLALNALLRCLQGTGGAGRWSEFKRKQAGPIDLTKADLSNQALGGYDFSGVNLAGATLFNAELAGADFSRAHLAYANLTRANLANAYFSDANLSGAALESVNAVDTNFDNAVMTGCKLAGAHLAGASMAGADLTNADFRGANLKYAVLLGATILAVNVDEANLAHCRVDEEAWDGFRRLNRAIGGPKPLRRVQDTEADLEELFTEEDANRILEISPGASLEEISRAYKQKVREYHPDRVQTLGRKIQIVARREFDRIQKAYRSLSRARSKPHIQISGAASHVPHKAPQEYSLDDLEEMAKANPNDDCVMYNLGLKYFALNRLEESIAAYERALRLNANNRFAEHNLKIAKLSLTLRNGM